jgi:hypothetical protein
VEYYTRRNGTGERERETRRLEAGTEEMDFLSSRRSSHNEVDDDDGEDEEDHCSLLSSETGANNERSTHNA